MGLFPDRYALDSALGNDVQRERIGEEKSRERGRERERERAEAKRPAT